MVDELEVIAQDQILVFTLDEPRYALYVLSVERVVRAVEITPLPNAPEFILGAINVQGQIIPVVDIRKRLHLPSCDVHPDNQFILARTSRRLVALVADSVAGVNILPEHDLVNTEQVLPGMEFVQGLVKLDEDLVLICDLDKFLSFEEEQKLVEALAEAEPKKEQKTHTMHNKKRAVNHDG